MHCHHIRLSLGYLRTNSLWFGSSNKNFEVNQASSNPSYPWFFSFQRCLHYPLVVYITFIWSALYSEKYREPMHYGGVDKEQVICRLWKLIASYWVLGFKYCHMIIRPTNQNYFKISWGILILSGTSFCNQKSRQFSVKWNMCLTCMNRQQRCGQGYLVRRISPSVVTLFS